MVPERFMELDASTNPQDHIDNGHILIYTRQDPETKRLAPHLNWMKSISPSNPKANRDEWEEIIRPTFTNEDLLEAVSKVPQIIY